MKQINFVLICIIIALIFSIIGFAVGMTVRKNFEASVSVKQESELNTVQNEEKKLAGTYKTNTWNGHEAVLVLNKDKSMIHPSGNTGTWILEDGKVYLDFKDKITTYDGNGIIQSENEIRGTRQEAIIVDGGLMINTHFFEKIH